MSLEEKFSSLSIGDESAIGDAIKEEGVEKSGFADNIDVLVAKCASNDDDEALAGLATTLALAKGCPEAEAFTKECLTACKLLSFVPKVLCNFVDEVKGVFVFDGS
jgi:hypothetical protein